MGLTKRSRNPPPQSGSSFPREIGNARHIFSEGPPCYVWEQVGQKPIPYSEGPGVQPRQCPSPTGGHSHSTSPRGSAKGQSFKNPTSLPLKPRDNRGNDSSDLNPPLVPARCCPGDLQLGHSREGSLTSCRGEVKLLRSQLEVDYQRPMDPRNRTGPQTSVCDHPSHLPPSPHPPLRSHPRFEQILTTEVQDLEAKRAISKVREDGMGFVSPMFLVPKSDGTWRPVVNLKALNRYVVSQHFKMESIRMVKGLIEQGDWLLKLDLKDAYLTVSIDQGHRKYLCFHWQGQMWQFRVLPFGLNSASWTFTKLTKPIVSTLRQLGIRVIIYLDDMLVLADSVQEARAHLRAVVEILVALGFVRNTKKSVFQPAQRLEFLGFVIDTRDMLIPLPHQRFHSLCSLQTQGKATICQLIRQSPLHYRLLERVEIRAAQRDPTYSTEVQIPSGVRSDLLWWTQHSATHNGQPLRILRWDLTIESDASLTGWGASCSGKDAGGPWTQEERVHHINLLELKAAFLALNTFLPAQGPLTVLLLMDNVTAIAFLNRMVGTHFEKVRKGSISCLLPFLCPSQNTLFYNP